jgi:ATP-dependent helicase/nuclease subunit A
MSTVVLASAGTGKTWSLVDAWVRAALGLDVDSDRPPPTPESLCAITFTEKAAAEMRARVEARLATLRFAPDDDVPLRDAVRQGRTPWNDVALDALRRSVGRAPIGTFHALCARLVREHAVAAGVDPGFRILEPDEEQRMLHEIAEGVVLDALADNDSVVGDLVARLPLRGMFEQRGFVEGLVAVWGSLAERGIDAQSLAPALPLRSVAEACAGVRAVLATFNEGARASSSKAAATTVLPKLALVERLLAAFERLRGAEAAGDHDDDVAEQYLTLREQVGGGWGGTTFTEHRRALVEAINLIGAALVDEDAAPLAPVVRDLCIELDQRQRREKDHRGLLGFGDLLVRCRDVLRDDPSVRARVKARFSRIFVDEYQDTSPIQEQLLALIAEAPARGDPLVAGHPLQAMRVPHDRLFIVGDPKQSIYGFRGADAAVFTRAEDAITSRGGRRLRLDVSRRSTAAICAFVNLVTCQTLPAHKDETLSPLPSPDEATPMPAASTVAGAWWRADGALAASSLPAVEVEAAMTAERLVNDVLASGIRPSQVLVLTRRSRSTAVFGRAINRRGVPVRVVGGDGFWRRPEILDIVSALSLVVDPRDELAALTVLRSPLVGLTDDAILALFESMPSVRDGFSWPRIVEATDDALVPRDAATRVQAFDALLQTVRSRLAHKPLSTLVDVLVDDGGYAVACAAERDGAVRLRHLEKLRAICASRGEDGVLGIARLQDAIDDPPAEAVSFDAPVDEDAVRIMTVHQSKGLEADVVIIADAGIGLRGNSDDLCFEPGTGLAVSPRGRPMARCTPRGAGASPSTMLQRARKGLRVRDENELARLLYVAVTRARRQLCIVGTPRRQGPGSMLGLLALARTYDDVAFDALLPVVMTSTVDERRRYVPAQADTVATTETPAAPAVPDSDVLGEVDDSAGSRGPLRVRASTLLARATPQLAMGLPGDGHDLHDDDVIPPRARGRLAHAVIGLIATERPAALDNEDDAFAAVDLAEHAIGAPPGAIDDALKARIVATLMGPLKALRAEGRTFQTEVPTVLVVEGVVVEGTADLVARGPSDTIVVELKLSKASARSEATAIQVLACCAGLEQQGHAEPLRAVAWAIGEEDPPPSQPWGKVTRRHLATVLAHLMTSTAT